MVRATLFVLIALVAHMGVPGPVLAHDAPPTKEDPSNKEANESDAQRRARLRHQRNDRILNREELEAAMAPHIDAIKDCYQTHTAKQKKATGEVQLGMLIRPKGSIQSLWIRTPGVEGTALEGCIRDLSSSWRFPEQPGFTNAVIPLYFQKTKAAGAGPFESCWSAKGCPTKPGPKKPDSNKSNAKKPKRKAR